MKYLFFFISTLLISNAYANDLITQSQNGTLKKITTPVNNLSENVQFLAKSETFEKISGYELNTTLNKSQIDLEVTGSVVLNFNSKVNKQLIQNRPALIELDIPVNTGNSITLQLFKHNMLDGNYELTTSNGKRESTINERAVFYRGMVKGNTNSLAAVSVFESELRIMIADDNGNYVIAKLKDAANDEHIFYNDRNLVETNNFTCGQNSTLDKSLNAQVSSPESSAMSTCVPVYVECDRQTYIDFGNSVTAVENYVAGFFNEVAVLYTAESINTSLGETFVWTSADPYVSLNTTIGALLQFGAETQNDNPNHLNHLVSTRNFGGGVAWVDVLCVPYSPSDSAGAYAFSAINTTYNTVPTYSWTVQVFTHEMGHNLGSRHTQACIWGPFNNAALDNCVATEPAFPGGPTCSPGPAPTNGGTIMSYCHFTVGINFNNGFGTEPGNVIRNEYNSASCALTCTEDITITSPVDTTWFGGNTYDITWIDNFSDNVRIQLYKAGAVYSQITNSTLSDGVYSYNVPAALPLDNDYQIVITNVTNATVADTSDFISVKDIELTSPTSGEVWLTGTGETITWEDGNSSFMRIELWKAGSFYSLITASTINDGNHTYNVPTSTPNGNDYQVMIRDNGNVNWNDTSDYFAIFTFPENCDDAFQTYCPGSFTDNTTNANTSPLPATCGTSVDGNGIWLKFEGTNDNVVVTTCNSTTNYDTKLHVYSGTCNNLTCVTGIDDDNSCSFGSTRSTVNFFGNRGTTYYVFASGYGNGGSNGATGVVKVDINCDGCVQDYTHDNASYVPARTYSAKTNITSTKKMVVPANYIYKSEVDIDLGNGFETAPGVDFIMEIDPCQ